EPRRSSLVLDLRGGLGNTFAIGAKVTAEVGGKRLVRVVRAGGSDACSSEPRLHFRLGAASQGDRPTIRWPRGGVHQVNDVAGGRALRLAEGGGLVEVKKP